MGQGIQKWTTQNLRKTAFNKSEERKTTQYRQNIIVWTATLVYQNSRGRWYNIQSNKRDTYTEVCIRANFATYFSNFLCPVKCFVCIPLAKTKSKKRHIFHAVWNVIEVSSCRDRSSFIFIYGFKMLNP